MPITGRIRARLLTAGIFVSGAVGAPFRFIGALIVIAWRGGYKILFLWPLSPRQQMFKDCFRDLVEMPPETIEEIVVEISREL